MAENVGLVVHVQVGTGSLFGWFSNPAAEVSAHFWIDLDGSLEQYVPAGTTAWAEVEGNSSYLSVETCGFPEDPLTDSQCATLAKLVAWGHQSYGWPLELVDHGGQGITTHAFYPSGLPDPAYGDHACPGTIRSAQLPGVLLAATATIPPEGTMILKSGVFKEGVFSPTPVTHYEQVVYQAATHWKPLTAAQVPLVPTAWIVDDNATGGFLNRFPVVPPTTAPVHGTGQWGDPDNPPPPKEQMAVPPEAAFPPDPVPEYIDEPPAPEVASSVTP
jgi:hypothetical protein